MFQVDIVTDASNLGFNNEILMYFQFKIEIDIFIRLTKSKPIAVV